MSTFEQFQTSWGNWKWENGLRVTVTRLADGAQRSFEQKTAWRFLFNSDDGHSDRSINSYFANPTISAPGTAQEEVSA